MELELIKEFGPSTGLAVYVIYLHITHSVKIKETKDNNTEEIQTLRKRSHDANDKLHLLELMINDRVKHEWAEEKLLPKIDKLSNDLSQLSIAVAGQVKTVDRLVDSIEKLSVIMTKHENRLEYLERQ